MLSKDNASFRDPYGAVYIDKENHRVLRTVTASGIADFDKVRQTGFIRELIQQSALLPEEIVDVHELDEQAEIVLAHPKLDFISYPYEWSFSALKAAALHHLDIQIQAIAEDIVLRDASAYNIQFTGAKPIFIDHLSFAPYKDGQLWFAQQQFLEQFLFPLLVTAYQGLPFNDLYRGQLNGVTTSACHRLLPLWRKFRLRTFTHVTLNHHLQAMDPDFLQRFINHDKVCISKKQYLNNLTRLRAWISGLKANFGKASRWLGYSSTTSYSESAAKHKKEWVMAILSQAKPKHVWDIGCNQGEFAQLACQLGANVIGFENCAATVDKAFSVAQDNNHLFTPLYQHLAAPSPTQGAFEQERSSLSQRGPADFLLALAVLHHLVITANLPILELLDYLTKLAPEGIIEFVPKDDPQCQHLLAWHPKSFEDYDLKIILNYLDRKGMTIETQAITDSKRLLIHYKSL